MSILDKVKIGNTVKVNLESTKDRLNKEIVEAIKISSVATIRDFRITDGKGIGVILKLSNGKEQWFFENEIDILDENGNKIEKLDDTYEKSLIPKFFSNLKYKNKYKISELLNPTNFIVWLIVSFKDIF